MADPVLPSTSGGPPDDSILDWLDHGTRHKYAESNGWTASDRCARCDCHRDHEIHRADG